MIRNMTAKYKLKIENTTINVDIDSSYSDIYNFSATEDSITSIKYQHSHLGYELFLIGEKPLRLFYENEMKEYKNGVLCIPPGFSHLAFRQNDYRICFSLEEQGDIGEFGNFIKEFSKEGKPFVLKAEEMLFAYAKELESIFTFEKNMNCEMAECVLKLIFYKLYRQNHGKEKEKFIWQNESYIIKIEEMINSMEEDLSLEKIAGALCLGTKQTSRIIHKNYNKSLPELISERKLNVACQLLKYTDKTVAEIVKCVDFSSERYFYALFKKVYGCTPMVYKKGNKEK